MSVALANSGGVQIELIQQRNDAPSMCREFLDAGREGLQHVAYWSRDYQALYDRALELGYVVGQEGCIGGPLGRFAYFDTEHDPATVIEISDISGPEGELFALIRRVARDWDGSNPVRELG
jgi:Glyoxalase/Bleomycin resistance protein/Dioxygenase superfamily